MSDANVETAFHRNALQFCENLRNLRLQNALVLIEKQTPQITVLTLNRPERRNALTIEFLSELNAAIKIASDQPERARDYFARSRRGVLHRAGFEGSSRPDEGACDRRDGREYV